MNDNQAMKFFELAEACHTLEGALEDRSRYRGETRIWKDIQVVVALNRAKTILNELDARNGELPDQVRHVRDCVDAIHKRLAANPDADMDDARRQLSDIHQSFLWAVIHEQRGRNIFEIDPLPDHVSNSELARRAGLARPDDLTSQINGALEKAGHAKRKGERGRSLCWSRDTLQAAFPHLPDKTRIKKYLSEQGFVKYG